MREFIWYTYETSFQSLLKFEVECKELSGKEQVDIFDSTKSYAFISIDIGDYAFQHLLKIKVSFKFLIVLVLRPYGCAKNANFSRRLFGVALYRKDYAKLARLF